MGRRVPTTDLFGKDLGSIHTWCPGTVPKSVLNGHECEHTLFLGTHTRIRAQCRCLSIRSRPCTQAQKWALGPCVHTIFVSSVQSTALFLPLSSYFKVAPDRAKWSNYVHSHISGTQSVNTTPFCAVTQALVLKHQVWTAPYQTIHMLNPLTERRYNNDDEEEDQNNTWFSVISSMGYK